MFAVFLFLTYYLQQGRGYTPIQTGVAFLPMSAAIMLSAIIATTRLRPVLRPRPRWSRGCRPALVECSIYAVGCRHEPRHRSPSALIMAGVGLGLVFSTSINSATLGVEPADAGVASATVSASQQTGASLGIALLSTVAASSVTSYITGAGARPTRLMLAHAAVHGDTTAFVWAAAIFAAGALIAAALFEHGTKALAVDARTAAATAH